MIKHVHVVGAGVAGLAAAVSLAKAGVCVTVHESAGHAGGRCRSFFDDELGCTIDNGNHLLLSGNRAALDYLATVGARDELTGPDRAELPFVDLTTGERWIVRPNAGVVPWWIFVPNRRVPGSRAWDYLQALRFAKAGPDATVGSLLGRDDPLYHRFWEPLVVAALNTAVDEAAAAPVWAVLQETFARGESACRPRVAKRGLSFAFVDPGLAYLESKGADVHFRARLKAITFAENRAVSLDLTTGTVNVAEDEAVILAVPAAVAASLVPELIIPTESRAIVNAHFRMKKPLDGPLVLGVIGATAHWIFVRGDIASVTVSAADALANETSDRIAAILWPEVISALEIEAQSLGSFRIVKEKRATIAQTPADMARRASAQTRWSNLYLAGDWTNTGLPATIEGSVRSGNTAARVVLASAATS